MGPDFRVLGKLEVLQDGTPLDLGSSRQQALLGRFLISAGEPIGTDRLIEDMWGEEAATTARHSLHVYVSRLRKALGRDGSRLRSEDDAYVLLLEDDELDSRRFERLVYEGRAASQRGDHETASTLLQRGLALWRGHAFEGFTDEVWARAEVTRLEELRLDAVECRIWSDLELGRHAEVVGELRDLVSQNPFRENFSEQLMLALYRCGRQADALRAYQATRVTLAQELGLDPGPALQRMEAMILSQDPDLGPRAGPQPASADWPVHRTSFIGRGMELALGGDLLAGSRLLTLTGPPGSGKTRLAIELAEAHADAFPDGVYFIPLTTVDDPTLVMDVIARAMDLRDVDGGTALARLAEFLRRRRVLLLLDNFEQILPAAMQVDELLRSTEHAKALVTSRAPLRIYGEQEFPVPPLSLPPRDPHTDLRDAQGSEAVALFVARARGADPRFSLTDESAQAVAEIVTQLDGLPLAIELAASRVRTLSPTDLVRLLTPRFALLTEGPTSSDERHRTMRDAISWSYELLDPGESSVMRSLAVFRGGFTLEASAAVAGLTEVEALARIDALLANSLVHKAVGTGRTRYALLELVREFALLELERWGDTALARRRHAEYFELLARRVEPLLVHAPGDVEVAQLRHDADNIREALQFCLDSGDPDLGLGIAGRLWRFWQGADLLTEGRRWLEALLARREASPASRATGLTALAGLAYWQADRDEAMARYAQALALYRSLGDRLNVADTLYAMSLTATFDENPATGERLAEEAEAAFQGIGSPESAGKVTMAKGFAKWKLGDLAGALDSYEQGVAIARSCDDPLLADSVLVGVAALTFLLGDGDGAMRTILEVVDEAHELGNAHITVWALDLVSSFAAKRFPIDAVRLAGAVSSLRERAGGGVELESLGLEDPRSIVTPMLGADDVTAAWNSGLGMDIERSVELARAIGSRFDAG